MSQNIKEPFASNPKRVCYYCGKATKFGAWYIVNARTWWRCSKCRQKQTNAVHHQRASLEPQQCAEGNFLADEQGVVFFRTKRA